MKKIISLIALSLSLTSFAQEERVVLNSKSVSVNGSAAILVRTSQTPDVVTVNFQVPMANSVCEEIAHRSVLVTSGVRCGYDNRVTGHTTRSVCIRRNPVDNHCVNYQTERVPVVNRFARTCRVMESYCLRYGTSTSFESDAVKIKFKNLPNLGGSEEETFRVAAKQERTDGLNVAYDITPIQTLGDYEIKDRGFFGSDKYVIEPK